MDKRTILIQLEVEVPSNFTRTDEKYLDDKFADLLNELNLELIDSKEYIEIENTCVKSYIGIIKFKANVPYEELEGFKFDTKTNDMDRAKEILNELCSTLSLSNNCQIRWEFEGIGQGHYHDNYFWGGE